MVEFKDWVSNFEFNVGWDRYSYHGSWDFVVTAECSPLDDTVKNLVSDLDGGDIEAYEALNKLTENKNITMEWAETPDIAMNNVIKALRKEKEKLDNHLQ